jgi:hypothetical protein
MKAPCRANLTTARKLLEFGVIDEGAKELLDLRRCAETPGCDDWQNCSSTVESAWRTAGDRPLPDAEPRPAATRKG